MTAFRDLPFPYLKNLRLVPEPDETKEKKGAEEKNLPLGDGGMGSSVTIRA